MHNWLYTTKQAENKKSLMCDLCLCANSMVYRIGVWATVRIIPGQCDKPCRLFIGKCHTWVIFCFQPVFLPTINCEHLVVRFFCGRVYVTKTFDFLMFEWPSVKGQGHMRAWNFKFQLFARLFKFHQIKTFLELKIKVTHYMKR